MGEIMLRLSPPGNQRFVQASSFDVVYGGGEANVAVSLANYGLNSCFVTKVPDNPIGQCAINSLRQYGVNTDYISRGGERLGIYFIENGASMRPSNVVYDRANSSMSEATSDDFDFDAIFKDARWFHLTGITAGLSDKSALLTEEALKVAKQHGVTVSLDLSYRKKLWTIEKARTVMTNLMQYVDVFFGGKEDFVNILGIKPDVSDADEHTSIYKKMVEQFNLNYIVTTLRESYSASDNGWSALLYDGNRFYKSKKYDIRIVDRVGAGDSFVAGFIYGLIKTEDLEYALEFATGASALKHTIFGDFNLVSVEEVENLINGDVSGRVQR